MDFIKENAKPILVVAVTALVVGVLDFWATKQKYDKRKPK